MKTIRLTASAAKFVFFLGFFLASHTVRAQLGAQWLTQFGSAGNDLVNGVAVDNSGNVFAGGLTSGTLLGQTTAGSGDGFVRKIDSSGTILWTRQFGSTANDGVRAVAAVGTDVVVAGFTLGTLPGQTSAGNLDGFVRRYDSAGAVVWTRQFGTSAVEDVLAVATDGFGNVFVGGTTTGSLGGPASGSLDAFVRKLDSNGSTLWTRQFGTPTDEEIEALAVDSSGNIFAGGFTGGTLLGQTNAGGADDAFVLKIDSGGTTLWIRQFGSSGSDAVNALATDGAGNVFAGGGTDGTLPGQTNAGSIDAFVRKLDASGASLWTTQFGTSGADNVLAGTVDGAGNVIVGGNTSGSLGGLNAGSNDAYVRQLDANGTPLFTQQFGTAGADVVYGVAVDGAGHHLAGGSTGGIFPTQTNAGGLDAFVTQFVPEPSISAMLGLGSLLLGLRRKRFSHVA